jgi:hypothetical protein
MQVPGREKSPRWLRKLNRDRNLPIDPAAALRRRHGKPNRTTAPHASRKPGQNPEDPGLPLCRPTPLRLIGDLARAGGPLSDGTDLKYGEVSATSGELATREGMEPEAFSERATGLEPATSSLGSWHSTTELRPRVGRNVRRKKRKEKRRFPLFRPNLTPRLRESCAGPAR